MNSGRKIFILFFALLPCACTKADLKESSTAVTRKASSTHSDTAFHFEHFMRQLLEKRENALERFGHLQPNLSFCPKNENEWDYITLFDHLTMEDGYYPHYRPTGLRKYSFELKASRDSLQAALTSLSFSHLTDLESDAIQHHMRCDGSTTSYVQLALLSHFGSKYLTYHGNTETAATDPISLQSFFRKAEDIFQHQEKLSHSEAYPAMDFSRELLIDNSKLACYRCKSSGISPLQIESNLKGRTFPEISYPGPQTIAVKFLSMGNWCDSE